MTELHSLLTGAKLPPIGFGTWMIPDDAAEDAVREALKAGYRLIDTAYIYRNERGVGRGVRASGLKREALFITTKLWNEHQGYEEAKKAFRLSLANLEMDYVDLYIIHWPITYKRQDSWRALEEIHKSGKAKAIGVSNYTVRHLTELLRNSEIVPAVNQVEFHPFLYDEQRPILEFCQERGIVFEAYSPLARAERLDTPLLSELARKYDKSNAQIALRWSVQMGAVPIPKSQNPGRIVENIAIFDFELTPGELERICGLSDGFRTCPDPNLMP
jgi:diketogulonate reductase-like aldo/keto reductase